MSSNNPQQQQPQQQEQEQQQLALDTITAMRRQEEAAYATRNYLHCSTTTTTTSSSSFDVDVDCYHKIAEYSYKIADFCDFSRETVEIAMNCLHRYLMVRPRVLCDRTLYQLASLTAWYTAVKVHEPTAIDPASMVQLSGGCYTVSQIEATERDMLDALQWRVNPPTSAAFVRQYLALLPSSIFEQQHQQQQTTRAALLEIASFQTELAVTQYQCGVAVRASVRALAAVLNALEAVCFTGKNQNDDGGMVERIEALLCHAIGLPYPTKKEALHAIRHHMYSLMVNVTTDADADSNHRATMTRTSSSPSDKAEALVQQRHQQQPGTSASSRRSCKSTVTTHGYTERSPRSIAVQR